MGMSTHILGFKPPDEKWKKMKAVWDSCIAAGVDPPTGVHEFFGYEPPDEQGVRVTIADKPCVRLFKADMKEGFEVDVRKLPSDVTILRFYNAR